MLKRLLLLSSCFAFDLAYAAPQGLYGSECQVLGSLSATKDVFFAEDRFEMVQTIFVDDHCQVPAYDFAISGPYRYDEISQALDLVFQNLRMTILEEAIAEAFTRENLCGIDNWQAHEAVDVGGQDCGGQVIPKPDTSAFDLLALEGEKLRFGKVEMGLDGSSPQKRPRALDNLLFHAK